MLAVLSVMIVTDAVNVAVVLVHAEQLQRSELTAMSVTAASKREARKARFEELLKIVDTNTKREPGWMCDRVGW